MKPHALFILALLTLQTSAQVPGIDSLKILPASPTENDTIRFVGFITSGNDGTNYDHSITVTDTNILIYLCYVGSGDATIQNYNDTVILGKMSVGTYILKFDLKEPYYWQVDSPMQCRSDFPYYDSAYVTFAIKSTNAIRAITSMQLQIYPSPTNGILELALSNISSGFQKISILDISGQTLSQQTINPVVKNEIDVTFLSAGIYFIQLQDGQQSLVRKFVKE